MLSWKLEEAGLLPDEGRRWILAGIGKERYRGRWGYAERDGSCKLRGTKRRAGEQMGVKWKLSVGSCDRTKDNPMSNCQCQRHKQGESNLCVQCVMYSVESEVLHKVHDALAIYIGHRVRLPHMCMFSKR